MSKLVTFLIGYFVSIIPEWEIKKKKFFNNRKRTSKHPLIDEMFAAVLKSDSVRNDNQIDQDKLTDSKMISNHKKSLFRFLNQCKESAELTFPIKAKRRSKTQMDTLIEPIRRKQTRLQSGKCSSLNCEWKEKYMEEKDKNILLQSEIEELTKKLDYAKSQSSIDESSQASSHPWSQSSIPLLKTEKQGCVKQYSTEMFRLSIILIVSCNLSAEIIPSVLNCILVAAQIRHLDLPKIGFS